MLLYERNYKIETDNNNWIKLTSPTYPKENAQYKNNIISLTTKYSYEVGSCPISMGPPIIPIIPMFFFCFGNDSDLFLEFRIENKNDGLSIDMQSVKLLKSENQAVPVYRAHYCTAGEGQNSSYCDSTKNDHRPISTSPLILNKGSFILTFSYLKIGNSDELTFEFGKIFSEGKQINLPPLKLRRSNGMAYIPLMLSGHEPVFR